MICSGREYVLPSESILAGARSYWRRELEHGFGSPCTHWWLTVLHVLTWHEHRTLTWCRERPFRPLGGSNSVFLNDSCMDGKHMYCTAARLCAKRRAYASIYVYKLNSLTSSHGGVGPTRLMLVSNQQMAR